nr:zinc finger, CCHC-type, retrotransposon Gag domain protein [Tanacetum cinerariifolium]
MLSRISFHVLYGRPFKTLCHLNYALMKRHDYDITVFFTKRGVTIMVSEPGYETMVNTRTDAELAAAVLNALQTLLPQIRVEIHEEFHTGSGPLGSGGNPPSVTIHTWLERFNKQKPRSFEKATAPVDAENWISHMEKIFDVIGCEDAFKTRLAVYKFKGDALAWWKAYKQAKCGDVWLITVTWVEFKELFFLQFFPRAEQER